MEHKITTGVSKERGKELFDEAMKSYMAEFKQYSPEFKWTGEYAAEFAFKAGGMNIKGSCVVQDGCVDVATPGLPWMARMAMPSVMKKINEEVQKRVQ